MKYKGQSVKWNPPKGVKIYKWFENGRRTSLGIPPANLLSSGMFVVRSTGPDDYEGYLKRPQYKEF